MFNLGDIMFDTRFDEKLCVNGIIQYFKDDHIYYKKKVSFCPELFSFIEKISKFCFKFKGYYFSVYWDLIPVQNPNFKQMKIYHYFEWCSQFKNFVAKCKVYELNKIMSSTNPLIYILDYSFKSLVHKHFNGSVLEHSLKFYDNTFCNIDSTNPNIKVILKWEKYIGFNFATYKNISKKFNKLCLLMLPDSIYNINGSVVPNATKVCRFVLSLTCSEGSTSYLVKGSLEVSKKWKRTKFNLFQSKMYIGLAVHYKYKKFFLLRYDKKEIWSVDTQNNSIKMITVFDYVKKIIKKR